MLQNYAGALQFFNTSGGAWNERMRITANGEVCIGTGTPFSVAGYQSVNINGPSGSIINFCTNAAYTGRVLCASSFIGMDTASPAVSYQFSIGGTAKFFMSNSTLCPAPDGSIPLGQAPNRWSTAYLATAAVVGSDARLKTAVSPLTEQELAASEALAKEMGTWQYLAKVEEEGADVARLHTGMTVQRAMEVMTEHGLDPMRYAAICHDQWDDQTDEEGAIVRAAGDLYSFRTDELLFFITRGIDERLSALEEIIVKPKT
jgi:hypothetical protein